MLSKTFQSLNIQVSAQLGIVLSLIIAELIIAQNNTGIYKLLTEIGSILNSNDSIPSTEVVNFWTGFLCSAGTIPMIIILATSIILQHKNWRSTLKTLTIAIIVTAIISVVAGFSFGPLNTLMPLIAALWDVKKIW